MGHGSYGASIKGMGCYRKHCNPYTAYYLLIYLLTYLLTNNHCHRVTTQLQFINGYYYYYYYYFILFPPPLTHRVEQSPSWEANRFAASQEIRRILWNLKVYYRAYNSPPAARILSQINPVHASASHFLKNHVKISSHLRLGLPSGLCSSGFPTEISVLEVNCRRSENPSCGVMMYLLINSNLLLDSYVQNINP